MNNVKPDYAKYSDTDLIRALETIDDVQYPERALEIYILLEKNMKTSNESIGENYSEDGFFKELLDFVFAFPFELQPTSAEMRSKLTRIKKYYESVRT